MSNQLLKVKFIQQKNGGSVSSVTASQQQLMIAVKQFTCAASGGIS